MIFFKIVNTDGNTIEVEKSSKEDLLSIINGDHPNEDYPHEMILNITEVRKLLLIISKWLHYATIPNLEWSSWGERTMR